MRQNQSVLHSDRLESQLDNDNDDSDFFLYSLIIITAFIDPVVWVKTNLQQPFVEESSFLAVKKQDICLDFAVKTKETICSILTSTI